jgi:hypothetical protein
VREKQRARGKESEGERERNGGRGAYPLDQDEVAAMISSQGWGDDQPSTELLAAREEDDDLEKTKWAGPLLDFGWEGRGRELGQKRPKREGEGFFLTYTLFYYYFFVFQKPF